MVFNLSTRYTTEQVGELLFQVECDRCKCEYYYVLSRIGVGQDVDFGGSGSSSARRTAENRSSNDLAQRLLTEAELVPCPKCHWINDEMIEGYRRSKFRWIGSCGFSIACIGTALTILAGLVAIFNPKTQILGFLYLICGPLASFAVCGLLMLIRNGLRRWIVLNRDTPSGIKIPEGSPRALLKDPISDKLVPADTSPRVSPQSESTWIFPIALLKFPLVCCGCLRQPTSDRFNYKCELTTAIKADIPRCGACARSDEQRRRTILAGIVISFQLVSAIAIYVAAPRNDFWFYNGIALFIGGLIGYFTAKLFGGPVRILDNDRSRGYIKLWFRNTEFGKIVSDHIGQTY